MKKDLNQKQIESVEETEGALLVLAGAGTGKTTVITNRIAYIVEKGLSSIDQILAVTFTNKAANEMKERIHKLVDISTGYESWIGTFHSICLRFLKIHYNLAGLKSGFTIADISDQKAVMKRSLELLNISEKSAPLKLVMYLISKLKDEAIDCHDSASISKYNQGDIDMTIIYPEYQKTLRESNMVDFDDLLMLVIDIFRKHSEILSIYQDKFKYILVDEYQDTNRTQSNLISMLSAKNKNICCVGDDDQSIYSWRGADISNILNFERHFKDAKVVTLNENYRSTQSILDFANEIISKNTKRYDKKLNSNIDDTRVVRVIDIFDDKQEANEIVNIIRNLISDGDVNFRKNIAILVRTTAQMRVIEEAFIKNYIPYKIVGGVKFYERKEIKDAMAYIKLLISDVDLISLERIINIPRRGIGEKTFEQIVNISRQNGLPILQGMQEIANNKVLSDKITSEIKILLERIHESRKELASDSISIAHICMNLLEKVGYIEMLKDEMKNDPSSEKRIDNVEDLLNNLSRFVTLQEFFDHMSLISDSDQLDDSDVVNVMTIHASKGLEFDAVILPGWEEDLFPNKRVIEESGIKGLEEERRLAYVAVTRSKRNLFILNTSSRFFYGKFIPCVKSRFLEDIDSSLYEKINKCSKYGFGDGNFQKKSFGFSEYSFDSDPRNTEEYSYKKKDQFAMPEKIPSFKNKNIVIEESKSKFQIGSKVSHSKFGNGVIVKRMGKFFEVKFEDDIRRVLDEEFLKFE